MRDIQTPITEAVEALEKSVNDMLVDVDNVANAFSKVHPYLLNLIALGLMKTVAHRSHDGRINPILAKAALELWPRD